MIMSDAEGAPYTAIEAALAACPILGYPVGCVPELVYHPENGNDPSQLAYHPIHPSQSDNEVGYQLAYLLSQRKPGQRRDSDYVVANGLAQKYSTFVIAAKWIKYYQNLIGG